MKAYSTDLRQKIIETYENERISQRQLAQRFRVATSFVIKLLKQHRETGDLAPKTSPGRPRELDDEQMKQVQALVEANPDATLDELRAEVAQACGVTVSRPTMGRVMKRLGFTRKKKPFTRVINRVNGFSGYVGSTGMRCEISVLKTWCLSMSRG